MPNGSRDYNHRFTLYAPAETDGVGAFNMYTYDDDPNGVITWAAVGDRCFQTGASVAWVGTSAGPAVWEQWGGAGGGLRTQFVWHPGGTADPDNGIYDDWDDVHTAASAVAVNGIDVEIFCIDTDAACLIPAAEYDMYHIQLRGTNLVYLPAAEQTIVSTADGCTFLNFDRGTPWISLVHLGTVTPLYTPALGEGVILVIHTGEGSLWTASGGAPILSIEGAGNFVALVVDPLTTLGDQPGAEAESISVAFGTILTIRANNLTTIYGNTVTGAGDVSATSGAVSSTIEDQPGVTGSYALTQASALYTPGVPANWGSSVPADVTAALDLIAANLAPVTP